MVGEAPLKHNPCISHFNVEARFACTEFIWPLTSEATQPSITKFKLVTTLIYNNIILLYLLTASKFLLNLVLAQPLGCVTQHLLIKQSKASPRQTGHLLCLATVC